MINKVNDSESNLDIQISCFQGEVVHNPLSTFRMEWDSTETSYIKIPCRELDHLDLPENFTDQEHEELLNWFNERKIEHDQHLPKAD